MTIPENNPAISNPSIGAPARGVEGDALGALNLVEELDLGVLEQILMVPVKWDVGPCRHFNLNRLEIGEFGYGRVFEGVNGAVGGQEKA